MSGRIWILRTLAMSALVPVLMGQTCVPVSPSSPDTVVIEMANYTNYQIEPRLFVDPRVGVMAEGDLIKDSNWVLVDPPLQPQELATYSFRCEDIGTFATDHAEMFISDTEYVPSDNGPWLVLGHDFVCGDTVTLNFIDDGTVFFTRVEVNGQFLTD